jgi:hypothetical protein
MDEEISDEREDGDGVYVEASLSQAFFFSPFNGLTEVLVKINGDNTSARLRCAKM